MFHAISLHLVSLARRVRDYRLVHDHATAASHGWQVQRVAAGTYRYRDPRFNAPIAGTPESSQPADDAVGYLEGCFDHQDRDVLDPGSGYIGPIFQIKADDDEDCMSMDVDSIDYQDIHRWWL